VIQGTVGCRVVGGSENQPRINNKKGKGSRNANPDRVTPILNYGKGIHEQKKKANPKTMGKREEKKKKRKVGNTRHGTNESSKKQKEVNETVSIGDHLLPVGVWGGFRSRGREEGPTKVKSHSIKKNLTYRIHR